MESSYSQINAVMGHFAADVIKENTGWLGTLVFLSYMIVSVHVRPSARPPARPPCPLVTGNL